MSSNSTSTTARLLHSVVLFCLLLTQLTTPSWSAARTNAQLAPAALLEQIYPVKQPVASMEYAQAATDLIVNRYGSSTVGFNIARSKVDHSYVSATGQSGIAAGAGGYQINVQGNTSLAGAAITSSADKGINSLSTASLTSTDLQNAQNTQASSYSISLSNSSGAVGNLASNALANLNSGAGLPKNGSQAGVTQSVISPGNITITGSKTGNAAVDKETDDKSNTTVASLTARDPKTANGSLINTLSLQEAAKLKAEQQRQNENAQAAKLVGEVGFRVVGDIAEKQGWQDSSPQKIALHAIAGLIQAKVGGTNGLAGAGAAALNEAFTKQVNDYIDKANPIPENATKEERAQIQQNKKELSEAASILLGVTGSALAGGNRRDQGAGGTIALTADRNNRQLHLNEKKLAADLAAKSKGKYTAAQIEDAMRNGGNSQYGEDITAGMILRGPNDTVYDKGAIFNAGADGKSAVQVPPNGGKVDADLAAFIQQSTGNNKSPYTWGDDQTGKITPPPPATANGPATQRYGQYAANGKVYTLPIADCPGVSCTNDTPIAKYGVSEQDQATIKAYEEAKNKELIKDGGKAAIVITTGLIAPPTLLGSMGAGAVIGGGSSAVDQTVDTGSIDPAKTAKDTAIGAAAGGVGYGVVVVGPKVVGAVGNAIDRAVVGDGTVKLTAQESAAIAKVKIENNARADDANQYDQFRKPDSQRPGGEWDWQKQAPNNGAVPGTTQSSTAKTGETLDRYGQRGGEYLSPVNTPYEARALPPGKQAEPYEQYKILKDFAVIKEEIAPAFGQRGGGEQLRAQIPEIPSRPATVNELIQFKYLEPKK